MTELTVDAITHPQFRPELSASFTEASAPHGLDTLKRYQRADGTSFIGRVQAKATDEHPTLLVATIVNIEETDALRESMFAAASMDPLTGLLRRDAFVDAAKIASGMYEHYGVLFIDLDDFKDINDRHGHAAGDRVLEVTARRIREMLRRRDLVGRYGGDEFVVLLSEVGAAADVLRPTRFLGDELERPIDIGETEVQVGASIGAVLATANTSIDAAIARADQAMYVDKGAHRAGEHPERVVIAFDDD